ncbi:MAG: transposase [Candidatus Omnitrophota bacterium]|nr:transposase [Candidatus Omnitrophota bacterium]
MKYRQRTSKQKSQIVLEGLSGQINVSAFCQKYQISQTQYYKWRDLFLKKCHQPFEVKQQTLKEQHLEQKVSKVTKIIGGLTVELKRASTGL